MAAKAIVFKGVTKTFGKGSKANKAVSDLSLEISRGEVFGFLGPNGAGKSTSIKLLMRFIIADCGSMYILGEDTTKVEFREKIGYLSETPIFYEHLTARETLMLACRISRIGHKKSDSKIYDLLERLNLEKAISQRVGTFSKGMKQRLGMAYAIIHDPEILIFDEPMSGLDPLGRHLIKQLIGDLKKEGKTIFFSSHILSDIESLCDKIGIINHGRLLYSGGLESFVDGSDLERKFVALVEEDNHVRII